MYLVMVLIVYVGVSIYLGIKLKTLNLMSRLYERKILYWTLFAIAIAFLFMARSVGIGFLIYLTMFYAISDIIRLIVKRLSIPARRRYEKYYCKGYPVIILAVIISLCGYINARTIRITEYQIDITKKVTIPLKILMVSDLHIGTAVREKELNTLLERTAKIKPDVIFLVGDLYDESTTDDLMEYSFQILGQLPSHYGIYYVFGNHELSSDHAREVSLRCEEVGIRILQDEWELVDERFYVVGRRDYSVNLTENKRKTIKELTKELDPALPIIVLDHQPIELKALKEAGVDLAFFGHTHAGQMIPGNLFASAIYEQNYGLKDNQGFYSITSSGMGTWGYVLRTGSPSEIVVVELK